MDRWRFSLLTSTLVQSVLARVLVATDNPNTTIATVGTRNAVGLSVAASRDDAGVATVIERGRGSVDRGFATLRATALFLGLLDVDVGCKKIGD